jgi:hypothetical protein
LLRTTGQESTSRDGEGRKEEETVGFGGNPERAEKAKQKTIGLGGL